LRNLKVLERASDFRSLTSFGMTRKANMLDELEQQYSTLKSKVHDLREYL